MVVTVGQQMQATEDRQGQQSYGTDFSTHFKLFVRQQTAARKRTENGNSKWLN